MAGKEKENSREEKEEVEVDFGVGKISFGGLFKGLGNLIDLAAKLQGEAVEKKGEIGGLPRGAKGVYGFSIKSMGGKPFVESFGNIRGTSKGPVVEEVREPIVDVFEEGDHILVIAELPGVSEEGINVEVAGDILSLSASGEEREYAKEILLPGKVRRPPLKIAYKNGILEIELEKE